MMDRAPDLIEEVVAFRGWHLETGWPRVELVSFSHDFVWPTGEWAVAECRRGCEIPGERCSCGIYAALDRRHLHSIGYMGETASVIGEVGLAGKVIPGDLGWRAARARVRRLWVPHALWEHVRPLRAAYRVPVALTNPFERRAA
jgi:hypothetical protein